NLPVPLRRRGHAERAGDAPVAPNGPAHHQRTGRLQVPGKTRALRDEGRRVADLIDESALQRLDHPVLPWCGRAIIRPVGRPRMPIMITFRTGRVALIVVLAALMASCSREQQDWRSAEAADTSEAYGRFVEQHPDSELAARARERLAQRERRAAVRTGCSSERSAARRAPTASGDDSRGASARSWVGSPRASSRPRAPLDSSTGCRLPPPARLRRVLSVIL